MYSACRLQVSFEVVHGTHDAMKASEHRPDEKLEFQKSRLEGRTVKLSPRRRGVVILVERNTTEYFVETKSKSGKTKKDESKADACDIAWIAEPDDAAWLLDRRDSEALDKRLVQPYDPEDIKDDDILDAEEFEVTCSLYIYE